MKRRTKYLVAMLIMACMVLGGAISSYAVSTVRTITVNIDDNGDYKFPTITTGASSYKLKEAPKWSKEEANLVAGETVTATIVVIPEDGYEIRLTDGRNSVKLSGSKSGASISGYSRSGNEHTIKIKWIVNGTLPTPENAYWDDGSPWLARWDKVTNADSYQVQLYRDNTRIASYETKNRSYDFTEELASSKCADRDGVYFRVRAKYNGSKIDDSEWIESDEFTDEYWTELWYRCKQKGIQWKGTLHDDWDDDDWYDDWHDNNYHPNGPSSSSSRNGWSGNPGNWYYYQNGSLVKNNWVSYNGGWYRMDSSGRMITGWFKDSDGRWYYMTPIVGGPEGVCVKGWQIIGGKYYYFYPTYGVNTGYSYKESEMAANTWIDNWYVGGDGAWTGQTR